MIDVLFSKEEAAMFPKKGTTVFCIDLMLDHGDLNDGRDKAPEFRQFLEAAQTDGTVRIWYSGAPSALCGFYHLCAHLERAVFHGEIYAVRLPELIKKRNGAVILNHWGEQGPELFIKYEKRGRYLRNWEILACSFKWQLLVMENKPLRAVVNGKLVSVEADFYDSFIVERLKSAPVTQAQLIAELQSLGLKVRETLYCQRIEALIEKGRIIIGSMDGDQYRRELILKSDLEIKK